MKTSNIIIFSVIGFVLLLNIWLMVEIKSHISNFLTTNTKELKTEEVALQPFKTIIVSEEARVFLKSNNQNSFSKVEGKNYEYKQSGDTLFISGKGRMNIDFTEVENVILNDESKLRIESFQADYINIKVNDESKLTLDEFASLKADVYSLDNSRINVKESQIDTFNILSKDDARIELRGAFNVVRGEITNDSYLYVNGASNTQFTKGDNARINMF